MPRARIKEADFTRLVNRFGEVDAKIMLAKSAKKRADTRKLNSSAREVKTDIGEAIVRERPEDDVEWWDKPFLKDGNVRGCSLTIKLEDDKIGTLWGKS